MILLLDRLGVVCDNPCGRVCNVVRAWNQDQAFDLGAIIRAINLACTCITLKDASMNRQRNPSEEGANDDVKLGPNTRTS